MSAHLSDVLLTRFAAGELPEGQALDAALHLDDCPQCARRLAALDPLTALLASCPDPLPPEGLSERVFEAMAHQPSRPLAELGVGALLLLGGAVALSLQAPAARLVRASVLLDTLSGVGVQLSHSVTSSSASLAATTLIALAACAAVVRVVAPDGRWS
ncbi:MAG: hypothetical protein JXX28_08680 [Deltaproteobacteria bacterium]|nr:hypothetical protein [Deltaproteobacteria bacterium]